MSASPMSPYSGPSPSEVVKKMETNEHSRDVAIWGCKTCADICRRAEMRNDTQLLIQLLHEGVCEAIIKAMNNYCEDSVEIANNCCVAIEALSRASRDLREFLGELGACDSVIYALGLHIGDPDISEHGSAAVRSLAESNISNSFRLAAAGACDVLVQTGNFGFNLRHPRSAAVSTNVCEAITLLCEAANSKKLLDSGACEVVVSLLKFHINDLTVVRATLTAICGLASMTAGMRAALSHCKAPLLIADAAHVHSNDATVLLKACEAAMHLSLLPSNAVQFEHSGGCEMLVAALGGPLMEKDFGPEVCCCAMLQIVTNAGLPGSIDVVSAKIKLINAKAVDTLKRVAFSSRATQRAREHAKDLLHMLQDYNPSAAGAAVDLSAPSLYKNITGGVKGTMDKVEASPTLGVGNGEILRERHDSLLLIDEGEPDVRNSETKDDFVL